VPAAAVIPAPKAYIKVVAVKKLVVGFLARCAWSAPPSLVVCVPVRAPAILGPGARLPFTGRPRFARRLLL
jgi:hypothetical protein